LTACEKAAPARKMASKSSTKILRRSCMVHPLLAPVPVTDPFGPMLSSFVLQSQYKSSKDYEDVNNTL
jgi:hypothetical protein